MWRNVIGQSVLQVIILLVTVAMTPGPAAGPRAMRRRAQVMLFDGPELLGVEDRSTEHFTMVPPPLPSVSRPHAPAC
jgi:hypothetical protein